MTDGEGEGLIVGEAVAVGVAVAVAVGVGVGWVVASSSLTTTQLLTSEPSLTAVTVGFPKVGKVSPPFSIATVPVEESVIIFELATVAVSRVQFSQKVKTGEIVLLLPLTVVVFPKRSKRIVTGKSRFVPRIFTPLILGKLKYRISEVSSVPF